MSLGNHCAGLCKYPELLKHTYLFVYDYKKEWPCSAPNVFRADQWICYILVYIHTWLWIPPPDIGVSVSSFHPSQKHLLYIYFFLTLRFPWLRSRAVTTHLFGLLALRVLYPPLAWDSVRRIKLKRLINRRKEILTGIPQGLTGCTLPFDFPLPPPWGWSPVLWVSIV